VLRWKICGIGRARSVLPSLPVSAQKCAATVSGRRPRLGTIVPDGRLGTLWLDGQNVTPT
jgi:hypothetical protein